MDATFLIVDDSKLARIVMKKAIAALQPGWKILEADSVAGCIALLEQQVVDVIVIDFNMPGRNGLSAASELRRRFAEMPIALVTANVQDELIAQARAAAITFIAKPVSEDTMRGFISGAALKLRARKAS